MKCTLMAKLLLGAGLLISFSGCEKEDAPETNYYFTAKLNGEEKNFLHGANFQGGGNDGRWEHIVIGGSEEPYLPGEIDEDDIPPSFVIDIWNMGGDFGPGTHISTGETGPDTDSPLDFTMDGEYHPHVSYQFDQRDNGRFTFVVTEISEKTGIKGTFEGIIVNENNSNDIIEVTDGKLYLPYGDIVNP